MSKWLSYAYSATGPPMGWFRIFGYGIRFKHISRGLMFSERNGYRRFYKIGNYYFGFLVR
jgi:hypothetical protein